MSGEAEGVGDILSFDVVPFLVRRVVVATYGGVRRRPILDVALGNAAEYNSATES